MAHPLVRAARPSEAPALTALARRAKASWGYPASWLEAWAAELTFTRASVASRPTFVAEIDGTLAGVVALAEGPLGMEIAHLWVEPTLQGRGVGRALCGRAAEAAREAGRTVLRVESDPYALGFYERMGGRLVGEVDAPVQGMDRSLPVVEIRVSDLLALSAAPLPGPPATPGPAPEGVP